MDIAEDEVRRLARLCRIGCSEEKRNALVKDFQNIVNYIDALSKIDTTNIEPCVCVSTGTVMTPLRDDVGENFGDREGFLRQAPENIAGLVRVPTVMSAKEKK